MGNLIPNYPLAEFCFLYVCIKQVPDSEARLRIAGDGKWIEEDEVQFVINESDDYALEEGLTLAEKTGGEVVVFSLGPDRVREALRKALALGAARAVHLSDDSFAGGDSLATGNQKIAQALYDAQPQTTDGESVDGLHCAGLLDCLEIPPSPDSLRAVAARIKGGRSRRRPRGGQRPPRAEHVRGCPRAQKEDPWLIIGLARMR